MSNKLHQLTSLKSPIPRVLGGNVVGRVKTRGPNKVWKNPPPTTQPNNGVMHNEDLINTTFLQVGSINTTLLQIGSNKHNPLQRDMLRMTSGSNKHNSSAKFRHNTSLTSGKLVVGSLFGLPKNFPRGKLRKRSQIRNYLLHRECSYFLC